MTMTEQLHNIYYNQALQYIIDHNLEEGKRKLIKAITFDNNQTTTWNLLGLIYYKLGKLTSAQYCWKESIELSREDDKAIYYLNECEQEVQIIEAILSKLNNLIRARDFKKAKKVIGEIPEQIANKVDILNYFGLVMIMGSDIERARGYWMKSLNISVGGMAPIYLAKSFSQKKLNETRMNFINYLKRKLGI